MDLVDTLPDVRYWSKILHCSIPTPHLLTDLEVTVTLNMPWDGAGGQNIEHPHTLAILSFFFFFFLQMHFSFIGKA